MRMCTDHEQLHRELTQVMNEKMPPDENIGDLADLFRVFGDPTRMKILFVLLESEACVGAISGILGMTDSAVSHQLRLLKNNKLVRSRKVGKNVLYSLADDHVRTIVNQGMEHILEEK